jgi:hypothetical protein
MRDPGGPLLREPPPAQVHLRTPAARSAILGAPSAPQVPVAAGSHGTSAGIGYPQSAGRHDGCDGGS